MIMLHQFLFCGSLKPQHGHRKYWQNNQSEDACGHPCDRTTMYMNKSISSYLPEEEYALQFKEVKSNREMEKISLWCNIWWKPFDSGKFFVSFLILAFIPPRYWRLYTHKKYRLHSVECIKDLLRRLNLALTTIVQNLSVFIVNYSVFQL